MKIKIKKTANKNQKPGNATVYLKKKKKNRSNTFKFNDYNYFKMNIFIF